MLLLLLLMEKEKIIHVLRNNTSGLSITELVKISKLSRSVIRTSLAKLEGADKVSVRNVGMAKVYLLKKNR